MVNSSEVPTSVSFDFGPPPPQFNDKQGERQYVKERLALAYRVIAHEGLCEGSSGHLTSRDPIDKDCFWVNPYGLHFSQMTASDLLLVNHEGCIIEGGKPDRQRYNAAAFVIHSAIHSARSDVASAVHTHSPAGKAFATLGRELPMYTQDAAVFHNDIGLYASHGGVVLDSDESAGIVQSLGAKKATIMQNHGILTVGGSIESAVAWFYLLEKECACVLKAEAAAAMTGKPPISISEEAAHFSWKETGLEEAGRFEMLSFFDMVARASKDEYKT
ncbi:class II aldolase/adducin N-terminal [Naematelia encephala]|uniref:Class II aldolase/adducin N-terminal n=1 Tax=Naematelia encephala TaxID=71784 RepID=A0A1Y2BM68_9TREE|nr:class II aldolase/adducin N-terminal [Naematelia encephala]